MNFTRVMVATLIAAAVGTLSAEAQSLQAEAAVAPAEFPPASFTGTQYVDSRGCIFIRAGIDGNVTWVPRVTRSRQLICGYQPSLGSQAAAAAVSAPAAPTTPARAPVEITLAPELRPAASPQPATVAAAAPRYQPAAPVPQPHAAAATPRYQSAQSAPRYQPAPVHASGPGASRVAHGPCPDASPLSQQYINNSPDVRCGPQREPQALAYRRSGLQLSSVQPYYPAGTRVVPRHVYDARQNTADVTVPSGYRPVWTDDRLNPHRAEVTLVPAQISAVPYVPAGYLQTVRDDDRLNLRRGIRTEGGDAQTDLIWTKTVPRRLVKVPTDRPVIAVPDTLIATDAPVVRVSTRSAREDRKTEFVGR